MAADHSVHSASAPAPPAPIDAAHRATVNAWCLYDVANSAFATTVIPAQEALRGVVDELESLVADDLWPLPKYRELLFQY